MDFALWKAKAKQLKSEVYALCLASKDHPCPKWKLYRRDAEDAEK